MERVWEDKLRQAEQIDIEYESWRRQQPISLAAADRAQIISLGEDLPKLWDAASVVERKQILRLVVKEVVLDQRPDSGQSGSESSGRPVPSASTRSGAM